MTDDERRKKVLEGFLHDFPTLEEARKDLSRLGGGAIQKAAKGKKGNWYHPASSFFKGRNVKNGKWYEDVLPNLVFEAGWFGTMEESRKFTEEVRADSEKKRRIKDGDAHRRMTKDEILAGFKKEFPTLEEARKDLSRLGNKANYDAARGKSKYWYGAAISLFKREDGKRGKYYEDVLPKLVLEAGWFGTIEEAKKFTKEVRAFCDYIQHIRNRESHREMDKDEILDSFKREFPSLEDARKDLSRLGNQATKKAANGKSRHWHYAALSMFRGKNVKGRKWYDEVLPNLVFAAAWFGTKEEAEEFAKEVQTACKNLGKKRLSDSRRKMTLNEVITAFKKEFPSLDEARNDLSKLGHGANHEAAKGKKGHLYYPSRSVFKKTDRTWISWYDDVLPNLVFMAGWFSTKKEAKKFSEEVKEYCEKMHHIRVAETRRGMDKDEMLEAFRREFPSLEEARKDLSRLGNYAIQKAARGKKVHWYYCANSIFKGKNEKKTGNWYEVVLPNLVLEVGWFGTLEEARKFTEEVRVHCKKVQNIRGADTRRGMDKDEMLEAFRREFPSLEEARKDLSRLGGSAMQKAARGKKHWFTVARSLFKKDNGKPGVWFENILPGLVFESGWFSSIEESRKFAEEVKTHCIKIRIERFVASQKKKDHASKKTFRQYAIVTESFRREAKHGTSFEGIGGLLGIGDLEPNKNCMNGMARAILNSPTGKSASISPAELLRFKMSTGKWGGEMAEAYAKVFPCIAPYLTTRLLMLHALGLAKDGRIPPMNRGASFMSGPGEVYQAFQDLKSEIEKQGMEIPTLIDVDAEKDMLKRSSNPNRIVAVLPSCPLAKESLDFVECSSLYQFSEKRMPNIVKDVILEANRVIKIGGVLILASTAKRFGHEFERAISMAGFDMVTPANTRLMLSNEAQKRIEENLGGEVLAKADEAVHSTYFLIAVKSGRTTEETPAEWFRFERPKTELPEEAKGIAAQARRFDHDLKESDASAEKNITRMSDILDGLSPETHLKHAELIQSILSKYMLDKRIMRPGSDREVLQENAQRILNVIESISLAEEKDRYFATLRRMAKTHANKLRISGMEKTGNKANK